MKEGFKKQNKMKDATGKSGESMEKQGVSDTGELIHVATLRYLENLKKKRKRQK